MTTRFLLTVISAFFFNGDQTLIDIHEEIARDASKLFTDGLDVTSAQSIDRHVTFEVGLEKPIRLVCVGLKGDWVYLRKVTWLAVYCYTIASGCFASCRIPTQREMPPMRCEGLA